MAAASDEDINGFVEHKPYFIKHPSHLTLIPVTGLGQRLHFTFRYVAIWWASSQVDLQYASNIRIEQSDVDQSIRFNIVCQSVKKWSFNSFQRQKRL